MEELFIDRRRYGALPGLGLCIDSISESMVMGISRLCCW